MFRSGIPESGILRKNKVIKENLDDLLVFGYACKLFRDDEKALYIDQGKHLIPWMGEDTLRIDRYDGRGTLSDLKTCEASREGYDTTRWLGLNESERKVEQLCDEERYYSLTSNEEEELLYKEEELKRQKANEFQYNYDDSPNLTENDSNSQESIQTVEQDDRPYVPRPELDVPVDISIPKTIKENARVEKTAMFVSKQGLQMEILIKAKQANNTQFGFMNQADPLYKYYRLVVAAFKSGRYTMTHYGNTDDSATDTTAPTTEPPPSDGTDQSYLHPSLATNHQPSAKLAPPLATHLADQVAAGAAQTVPEVTPPPPIVDLVPTIGYRPRADCAYTQLITRIKGAQQQHAQGGHAQDQQQLQQGSSGAAQGVEGPGPPGGPLTVEQQQQYCQYYYTAKYYDGYKQLGQQYTAQGLDPQLLLQNKQIQDQIQTQASQYAQAALSAYMAQFTVTAATPQPNQQQTTTTTTTAVPSQTTATAVVQTQAQSQAVVQTTATVVTAHAGKEGSAHADVKKVVNPLLTLAHYGSDTEDEEDDDEAENDEKNGNTADNTKTSRTATKTEAFLIPSEDVAVIIDKMAAYVSKNGADFENIVQARGDPRFEFLQSTHLYNKYYKHKLKEHLGPNTDSKDDPQHNGTKPKKTAEKQLPLPVSFSIKVREEPQKEIKQSALPMEESDEENDVGSEEVTAPVNDNDSSKLLACATSSSNAQTSNEASDVSGLTTALLSDIMVKQDGAVKAEVTLTDGRDGRNRDKTVDLDADDPFLEMIDLTNDGDDKYDTCKMEARLKDKALQMERRKKAAAFLKLKLMIAATSNKDKSTKTDSNIKENSQSLSVRSRESTPRIKEDKHGEKRGRRESTQSRNSDVVEVVDSDDNKKSPKKKSRKKKSHKRKHSKSRSHREGSSTSSSRHKSKKHRKRSPSSRNRKSRSRTRSSSKSS